ncbi:hypothetical protein LCGC14_2532360, partial [marine sediment metagenome]
GETTNVVDIALDTISADGGSSFSMSDDWTNAGNTIADLGIVTTVDVNGGTVDGTIIGGASAAAGTFAALVSTSISNTDGAITNVGDIALDSISSDGGVEVVVNEAGNDEDFRIEATGGITNALFVEGSSGNVCIKCTVPVAKLDIRGFTNARGIYLLQDSTVAEASTEAIYGDLTTEGSSEIMTFLYDYITIKGDESLATGLFNLLNIRGSLSAGYGLYNDIELANENNKGYGVYTELKTITGGTGSTGYGTYIRDDPSSTGGTQYGLYVGLDDPDVTNYAIYVEDGLFIPDFDDQAISNGDWITPTATAYGLDTTGEVTITLGTGCTDGQPLYLAGDDANTIHINYVNIRTTDGAALDFDQYDILDFMCMDNEWLLVSENNLQ